MTPDKIMLKLHAVKDDPQELKRLSRLLLEPLNNYTLPDYWTDEIICGVWTDKDGRKEIVSNDRGHIVSCSFEDWLDVLIPLPDKQTLVYKKD